MVNNPTQVSIPMRLFAMVLLSKAVLFVDKILKTEKVLSLLMLLHFLLVYKLLEESWVKLFQKDHTSQPKNHKCSQLIKIINKQSQFKSLKVKDHLQKIITCWADSILLVSQLLQEVLLKSRSLLKSIKTQFYQFKL